MSRPARALSVLLAGAGALHFAVPGFYDAMIPGQLPGKARWWTWGSGVAEFGVAAAVAHPRTRGAGAGLAAALFVAVFPANVTMAFDARKQAAQGTGSDRMKTLTLLRLPLQAPLIVWALRVRRDAGLARHG